jgi:hypothetical protein
LVVSGNHHDWSCPETLRLSTCLNFSGKCIISRIVFIADIVHQAPAEITCSWAALIQCWKTWFDRLYGFSRQASTVSRKMLAW